LNTKPWDIAASELIAREAGAQVSSPGLDINESAVFAGPNLLGELVAALSTATEPSSAPER
jgi:fructose-1,6-bisphosphatase/inositol monophosphatase family enzyme